MHLSRCRVPIFWIGSGKLAIGTMHIVRPYKRDAGRTMHKMT